MEFQPDSEYLKKLEANRAGKLTRAQRLPIIVGALVTGGGLLFLILIMVALGAAAVDSLEVTGVAGLVFLLLFLLMYLYLGLTLFVNVRVFLPDALTQSPVRQSRGKLKVQMPQRDRHELPFSYIVGDYSFAPFMLPDGIELQKGRSYVVYYAARSRIFLSIEPA